VGIPYCDGLRLKLSMDIVQISGSLDGCPSEFEEAFICIGISIPLYQKTRRLRTYKYQK
jgi:hypothetical protein